MMEQQLKKHAIGYNTVSSVDGVINARGVKSYPNNLEIFGYTHEIGEGEKSPDNPYTLVSLDSGAMSVDGVDYEHSIALSNNDTTIQVPVPIALNSVEGVSDYIFKDSDGVWKLMQKCTTIISTNYIKNLSFNYTDSQTGTNVYKIMYGEVISSGKYRIENVTSNIFHDMKTYQIIDNVAKLYAINNESFTLFIRYDQTQYTQFSDVDTLRAWLLENPFKIVYQAITPEVHTLSDYAQQLLNSFMLQNKNKISVEGNPDIKISGYLQK